MKSSDSITESNSNASSVNESNSVCDCKPKYLENNNTKDTVFGNYYDTCDWVECESTSLPGKIYYFNLRTLCATWTRPLSRNVKLQRFRRKFKIYDTDFTRDSNDSPPTVSSEDENCESIGEMQENKTKCKLSDTLARLYHGVGEQNFSDPNENDYSDASSFPKESYNEEDFRFEFPDSSLHAIGKHFLLINSPKKIQTTEKYAYKAVRSPMDTADFLEVEIDTSENVPRNEQLLSDDDVSSIAEQVVCYSSSPDDDVVSNYSFVPRLPKIKDKHLLKDEMNKRRKIRKRRNFNSKKRTVERKQPTKIICEMYGTKTINYDIYDPIEAIKVSLPPGVKQSNLSDSSVTSSLWPDEKTTKSVVWDNFEIPGINPDVNNLSSDSSSCSCSDCSCSEVSDTDTSENTSSSGTVISERNRTNEDKQK